MKESKGHLVDVGAGVAGQGVVQVADEEVAVVVGQRHEGAAHDDELDLVDAVAQLLQLLHPVPRLQVRVVPVHNVPGFRCDIAIFFFHHS